MAENIKEISIDLRGETSLNDSNSHKDIRQKITYEYTGIKLKVTGDASSSVCYIAEQQDSSLTYWTDISFDEQGVWNKAINITYCRNSTIVVRFKVNDALHTVLTLLIDPPRLDIESVLFCSKEAQDSNHTHVFSGESLKMRVTLSREVVQNENALLQYKAYIKEPGESGYSTVNGETKAFLSNKLELKPGNREVILSFAAPPNLSGAKIAVSFFLRSAVKLDESATQPTVRYYTGIAREWQKIDKVYWSMKEELEPVLDAKSRVIGYKHSALRREICNNEDGFLHIHTKQMYGEKVKVSVYERDRTGDDALIISRDALILDNVACVVFSMQELLPTLRSHRNAWFEGRNYDLVAKVEPANRGIKSQEGVAPLYLKKEEKSFTPAKSTIESIRKFIIGSSEEPKDEEKENKEGQTGKCPCCREAVSDMQKRLKQCFPKANDNVVKQISEAYCKYMTKLKMDTCWFKAHFFAQVSIESGQMLSITRGENLNYTRVQLENIFPSRIFKGKWNKKKWTSDCDTLGNRIYKDGKKEEIDAIYQKPAGIDREKAIANFVYANVNGNDGGDDGWNFRGRGLIQLTGRSNFKSLQDRVMAKKLGDIIANPDLVCQSYEIATYTSMLYIYDRSRKKTLEEEVQYANGQRKTIYINRLIGSEHKIGDSTNYERKQDFFDRHSSVAFKVDKCKMTIADEKTITNKGRNNIYIVDLKNCKYRKIEENDNSETYYYRIYNEKKLIEKYELKKTEYGYLPFPETGSNWGRYGQRDKGGDNYISEYACAALFGFLYSLPLNNYNESLYYNDISLYNPATDKTHKGHKSGNDIDFRYPKSEGGNQGSVYWEHAVAKFSSETDFIKTLELIIGVARKWDFTSNYVKKGKVVEGAKSCNPHDHHFHLGYIKQKK